MAITASDVRTQLRERYRTPEWALFFEVSDTTGVGSSRRADAVAIVYPDGKKLGVKPDEFEVVEWRDFDSA